MSWRAEGFRAWLWQRLTAVYMALFIFWFAGAALIKPLGNHGAWRDFVGDGRVATAFALFFAALLLHAWVGVRDVVIDYVRPFPLRFGLLMVVGGALLATLLWVLRIIFMATL